AIEEGVAGAAGPAVPAFGGGNRAPASMARRQVDRRRRSMMVHPNAPPIRTVVHLEHSDPDRLTERQIRVDLVGGGEKTRQCRLVVDIAPGNRWESTESDLQPFVRSIRPLAGTADADPAGDVAVEHAEGVEGRNRGRNSECSTRGSEAGVRVAVAVTAS